MKKRITLLALLISTLCSATTPKVVVAYVTSWSKTMPDPAYVTHVNYAFGHVNETFDGVGISNENRLKQITELKQHAPDLKVLLSIGGWGSGRFSEMAADDVLRKKFADDCQRVVKEYNLDGIDIDWEYPTSSAAKISASPNDTENFTSLMRDIRAAIGKDKLLTLATVAHAKYIDFKAIDRYVDFTNIMSYDMASAPKHHSALYRSENAGSITSDEAVKAHLAAGVPANKLVLGMPFYGRGEKSLGNFLNYKDLEKLEGYTKQWDEKAQVPYLTNANGVFVCGYDDPKSLAIKCQYIIDQGLLGGMYWDYDGDNATGDLRKTVYNSLKREKIRLNDNWEFIRGDLGNSWEAVRPVVKDAPEAVPIWKKISLPHCFNAEDAVDPDVPYYQGPGWYRNYLLITNPYPQGRIILHFEGAGQKTEVYIYTQHVGSHVGGYDEWTVDITDAVNQFIASEDAARFNGKIPLIIRCDNSRDAEMIPSDLSDFNVYGGIYRYLNLIYTPTLFLSNIHTDAVVDEKGKEGVVKISPVFAGQSDNKEAILNYKIFSPDGNLVKEENKTITDINADNTITWKGTKPALWSPDAPNLYTCELTLTTPEGSITGKEVFGFRHFQFKEHEAFYLNGKRLLLRGTHRHEDHSGLAAAMTEDLIIREIEMIKAMGANFIRLGHYQQSRIVLEQCDRLGILVWEEIPWCRGGLGGEDYQQQAKRMLVNMISQHRNHPSIILWGLGNENDWRNDFPEFDQQKIRNFMTELHQLAHQTDDSRLTSIRRCDFCKDIVDVYSPSIWAGWYSGQYPTYKSKTEDAIRQVNHFFHAEWGGDSHAHRHAESLPEDINHDKAGDWSETYICDVFDWHLKEQETMPWLTGSAFWTFKDFSTPIRPENPVPYMNQKGVVERDLTPKEAYYVVQSYWSKTPMLHIYGHGFPTRWGTADELKTLKAYSNCETVELFLNGISLGLKKRDAQNFPAAGLRWESALKSGNNTLKAIGKHGKTTVTDEISFDYETRPFGKPAEIHASIIEETDDFVWIEAELRDANGVVSLEARNFIYFESAGDGWLVANQGTSTGSKKVQAYNGRARIKLIKNKGHNIVSVKSDGLETKFVILN